MALCQIQRQGHDVSAALKRLAEVTESELVKTRIGELVK
jgi:hypothetical protein